MRVYHVMQPISANIKLSTLIMEIPMYTSPNPEITSQKDEKPVRSTLVSRNVTIAGHRTSVRLEPEMWSGLSEICRRERASLHEICTAVSQRKAENTSLTAAIRVFVMTYYRAAATDDGHLKASHGYGVAMIPANMAATHNVPSVHHVLPANAVTPSLLTSQSVTASGSVVRSPSPFMMGTARANGVLR